MSQKMASIMIAVLWVALNLSVGPSVALPEPVLNDSTEDLKDLLKNCTNKTIGDEVGYKIKLDTNEKVGSVHVIYHQSPYNAYGIFDYYGEIEEYFWYRIVSGYSGNADECGDSIEDIITSIAMT